MTFDPEMQDYRTNPFTQDVGRKPDVKSFQQTDLTRIDHEDPAIHYIGEGLPAPGETEPTWAGQATSTGTSPIPARADHSHDTFLAYGIGQHIDASTITHVAPGQGLLKHAHVGGQNYYASPSMSLWAIPRRGLYLITAVITSNRNGGGVFTGEVNIIFYYLNGTFGRGVYRTQSGIPGTIYASCVDTVTYGDANIGVNATIEIAYQHNDSVNHLVTVDNFVVTRLADV